MDEDAPVADGVLTYLSDGSTSIIWAGGGMPGRKIHFGSIKAPGPVHDRVLEFLKQNHGHGSVVVQFNPETRVFLQRLDI
jgi:hypothetical protein